VSEPVQLMHAAARVLGSVTSARSAPFSNLKLLDSMAPSAKPAVLTEPQGRLWLLKLLLGW